MNKIKETVFFLIIGAFIGFLVCYYIFVKKRAVEVVKSVEYVYIERNREEITEKPVAEVKINKREIEIIHRLLTPYYGNIKMSTILDRQGIQYNHIIDIGSMYLINSKSILGNIGYSYKSFGVSLYGGYSFELQDCEFGLGVNYKIKF